MRNGEVREGKGGGGTRREGKAGREKREQEMGKRLVGEQKAGRNLQTEAEKEAKTREDNEIGGKEEGEKTFRIIGRGRKQGGTL